MKLQKYIQIIDRLVKQKIKDGSYPAWTVDNIKEIEDYSYNIDEKAWKVRVVFNVSPSNVMYTITDEEIQDYLKIKNRTKRSLKEFFIKEI